MLFSSNKYCDLGNIRVFKRLKFTVHVRTNWIIRILRNIIIWPTVTKIIYFFFSGCGTPQSLNNGDFVIEWHPQSNVLYVSYQCTGDFALYGCNYPRCVNGKWGACNSICLLGMYVLIEVLE